MDRAPEDHFDEALNWEVNEMLRAQKSEARAWKITWGSLALAALSVAAVVGLTPLKTSEPYVIRVNETTGVVDVAKSMKDSKTTYDEVVRKTDLARYVRARESYSRTLAEHYYTTVGLMSSTDMAMKYQAFYNPQSNPKGSPLVVYGEAGAVEVEIKSVSFINEKAASVNYITKEYEDQLAGTKPRIREWVATITFQYVNAPLKDADREKNPFGFQALEFRRDPVSQSKPVPAVEATPVGLSEGGQ